MRRVAPFSLAVIVAASLLLGGATPPVAAPPPPTEQRAGAAPASGAPTSGAPTSGAPTFRAPNHAVPDLAALCESTRQGDHPFFGTSMLAPLRQKLAGPQPPLERLHTLFDLGRELFRLGAIDEARQRAEEAKQLAFVNGLPIDRQVLIGRLLAITHLRTGENANCVARHTSASCIFPIAGEGIHVQPEEARRAGDLYLELLDYAPDDPSLRWLLNLSRMASGDFPLGVPERYRLPAASLAPVGDFPRWRDVAPQLGLAVRNNAGGAAMDDFDGDGLLDLVTSTSDPCDGMKAFRNDGRGGFTPVADAWGLAGQLGGLNLVHADFDGDGMLDLLVLRGGWWGDHGRMRKSLLRNDLHRAAGRFVDVTAEAGLAGATYPSQTAAWADYDRDGDLDLYIGNEKGDAGPFPSQLYRNDGSGRFTEVAARAGVDNRRWAKGVAWGDYDDDGDPDLYVSNMGPNRLYRNNSDGTFTDVAESAGVTAPAGPSFATWFFDFDNDGDLDLFVADYGSKPADVFASYLGAIPLGGNPVLYRNEGDGRFRDVSAAMGVLRPALPMGSNYGDLDNDGWPDVYLGTGNPDFDSLMPNQMYRNDGGRRFQDVTFAGGFGHLQKGHSVAFGDLDNDGDQDLFEEMGGAYPFDTYAAALYENPGPAGSWVTLRLLGRGANRFALGARLEVVTRGGDGRRSIHAVVGSGGSFGGNSLQQEIGLGGATAIESLVVRWPAGASETFHGLQPRGVYRVVEGSGRVERLDLPSLHLGAGAAPPHHHDG
ncbi:MAG TPA: CRTAC1 family protein [Thermoanaerobaculia bacterium]|nr:CRTAC1 family protein [Thermoanaerobaculia bacterium]